MSVGTSSAKTLASMQLSAMKIVKGVKKGEATYLAALKMEDHVGDSTEPLSREIVETVFKVLRENELYVKREKCSFAKEEVHFLGHIIKGGTLRMGEEKVKAIKEWEVPTKVFELRSFLGLANYYRWFIKGYSAKAAPLTDLLKKGKTWEWSKRCQFAFEWLQEAVTEESILAQHDHTKVFELQTDASDFAIGGVLMQQGHPIAFESRKLNDTERRYTVQEKEMTAVVHCLCTWRHYLLGSRFLIKIDNIATSYFQSQRKLSPKQARWQDLLAEFDYVMEYKPGKATLVADALSRKAELKAMSKAKGDILEGIKEGMEHDPLARQLLKLVESGQTQRFWVEDGLLYTKGQHVYVPKWNNLRKTIIQECHDTPWEAIRGNYGHTPWWRRCPRSVGFVSFLVVVARFSKYATFVASPTDCTAEEAARLFLKNVVKYWGLPKVIVSKRDPRFTGKFWTEMLKLLGSELHFLMSFHPQTDRYAEWVIALLECYLRHFVSANQTDWARLLDVAQFSYNLMRSEATNQSPFEIAIGQQPLTPLALLGDYKGRSPLVAQVARSWNEQADVACSYLDKAGRKMKKWADKRRRPKEYNLGDMVMLKLLPQQFKSFRKVHKRLIRKYERPFPIVAKVGKISYRLELPPKLKIHPVFHVNSLKPHYVDKEDPSHGESHRAPTAVVKSYDKEAEHIWSSTIQFKIG
ncbi:hypothetical protein RJ640_011638 [Escallonia rubra]|uniref:Integrase catalytic domain-containing protein n=1 Tax=Escallonia rubra TaxID=112253 RepID=A0AA88QWX5_9ASTE|nr:hypothetical protein RJ640_011638 [Escallonia rubra]